MEDGSVWKDIGFISKQFAANSQVSSEKEPRWPSDDKLRNSYWSTKIMLTHLFLIALSHRCESKHATHSAQTTQTTHTQTHTHCSGSTWCTAVPEGIRATHIHSVSTYTISSGSRLWGRLSNKVPNWVHSSRNWLVLGQRLCSDWSVGLKCLVCLSCLRSHPLQQEIYKNTVYNVFSLSQTKTCPLK